MNKNMKSITLEEIKNLKHLTVEETDNIKSFDEDFSDLDCLPLTEEELKKFKSYKKFLN